MDRKSLLLLGVGCLLVVAIAAWRSEDPVAAPRALQLAPPVSAAAATPAGDPSKPGSVTPPPRRVAYATRTNNTSKAASGETPDDFVFKPAQPRRREGPAVAAIPSSNAVAPSTAPGRVPSPSAMAYERRVADAAAMGAEDLDRAARQLEQLIGDDPARPQAYETLAAIRLRQGDYYQAFEMFDSAIQKGGKATFAIMHDHTRGNFDSGPKDTCAGELTILPSEVTFEGPDGHRFAASWAEFLEAGSNKFFGSGIGGFHVKIALDNKKTRNFNLAPRSRDKREANLVLDLLIENAQRRDAGK
jgi:hypothetical protein